MKYLTLSKGERSRPNDGIIFLPLLSTILFLTFSVNCFAQFMWYENETDTYQIEYKSTSAGTFYTDVTNPDKTGINTNAIVSKFNRDEGLKSFLEFDLFSPVVDFTGYSITIKAYLDLPTELLTSSNSKLRIFFESSSSGKTLYKQLNFTVGQEWQSFTFDFDGTEFPSDALNFDGITIGFATGSISEPATTYYIDAISGTTEQVVDPAEEPAAWLAGSWGVTFPVFGGERLDSEVAGGYDLPSGAQEIVDELPAVGHIITNLSYFAHSHYFTLRGNNNVDVATEIHESLVPTIENEQIIFEVLQKFKDSGKRIILYISTNYLDRADAETQAAWVNYYTNNFGGDEYLAYEDLIAGYIDRVKDYADGYWLDTTAELNDDGYMEDFVEMIRSVDSGAAISASPNGTYFTENEVEILVDSDGIDDEDERDYKIVSFEGVNTYQDFTSGHITPLGQGAPPNSWGYEELTIPAMVSNPWTVYEGNTVLRHAWFPVRDRWHVYRANLIFGTEDAYRFAKQLVDANAGVTFATTIDGGVNKGHIMSEEMDIMKEINNRLLSNPVPDFEPYVRPEGAYYYCSGNCGIQAKVLLEGFYDAGTEGMHTKLQDKGLLPVLQPFNTAPWNYTGTESASPIPATAVDWVLVMSRKADGTVTSQAAGFIDRAGNLMSVEGSQGIPLADAMNNYFSIHTRSHLAILSANPYTRGIYDFTTAVTQAQGNTQLKLLSGKHALYAGDYDGSGIINNIDFNKWKVQSAKLNEYLSVDGDGNGIINAEDYNLWIINRSKTGDQIIRY